MAENTYLPARKLNPNGLQKFALARPILTCLLLFLIALFFRWVDGFVLRGDEVVGELIITKSLGFILVVTFVLLTGRTIKDIGLHAPFLRQSLTIGITAITIGFIVGYGIEIWIAHQQGKQPVLQFGAIDSKMGVTGGALFALWLLLGNIINSFMEEGLFRGVIGRLARIRFNFWGTIWFQAFIFSIWHWPWVLKYYLIGDIQTPSEIATSILFHSLPQLLVGIVYGYYYLKTNSLWTPWVAHAISNSVLNYVHVNTLDGFDTGIALRMTVNLAVLFMSLFWVRQVARKHGMPEVAAWE